MTSRERILTSLKHQEPDRVPVDLGSCGATGITAIAYNKLKKYLGIAKGKTQVTVRWQLAISEIKVLERVGADLLPELENDIKWKEGRLPDGSLCEVPETFNPEVMPDGSQVFRDGAGHITRKMPKGGYYFDVVYHPLENVNTIEDLKKYDFSSPIDKTRLGRLHAKAKHLYETTDYALTFFAGNIYERALELRPRGWANFMMDLAGSPDFASYLLDKLV